MKIFQKPSHKPFGQKSEKASPGNVDSSLFKSWSPGVGCGPKGGGGQFCFTLEYIEKEIFEKSSSFKPIGRNAVICFEASPGSGYSSLLKSWSLGWGWGHNEGTKFYTGKYREKIFKILFV